MTTKCYKHLVKGSGTELTIKRVSPMLTQELLRQHPEPTPPMQVVEINGEKVEQYNTAHPDYLSALMQYNNEIVELMNKLMLKRGIVLEITPEMKAEIDQMRTEMEEDFGVELNKSDKEIYITYIAITSEQDYTELINAVMKASDVNEEDLKAAEKSFRSEV